MHCLFLPVIFNNFQLKHPCGDWISEVSVTFKKTTNHRLFAGPWPSSFVESCFIDSDVEICYLRHIAESSILSITFSSKHHLQQVCVSMFNGEHPLQNLQVHPRKANIYTQKSLLGCPWYFVHELITTPTLGCKSRNKWVK